MEIKITCPFCDIEMLRDQKQVNQHIRVFRCSTCHSEFRQQMVISPVKKEEVSPPVEMACSACFESSIECYNCGDRVCSAHKKSWTDVSRHLPREMMLDLDKSDMEKLYCPMCFPLLLKRKTMKMGHIEKPASPFKNPWTLLLMAAVLFFSFAARKCSG